MIVLEKEKCLLGDLIPNFRTDVSMIADEGKVKRYVEEQAHRNTK